MALPAEAKEPLPDIRDWRDHGLGWGFRAIRALDDGDLEGLALAFIDAGGDINAQVDVNGYAGYVWTPWILNFLGDTIVHLACRQGKEDIAGFLLYQFRPNLDLENEKDESVRHAIQEAFGVSPDALAAEEEYREELRRMPELVREGQERDTMGKEDVHGRRQRFLARNNRGVAREWPLLRNRIESYTATAADLPKAGAYAREAVADVAIHGYLDEALATRDREARQAVAHLPDGSVKTQIFNLLRRGGNDGSGATPTEELRSGSDFKYLKLSDTDAVALFDANAEVDTLRVLRLPNRRLGNACLPAMGAMLKRCQTLLHLDVSQNCFEDPMPRIGMDGEPQNPHESAPEVQELARGIRRNRGLQELVLSGNRLNIASARLILDACLEHPDLVWLSLSGNPGWSTEREDLRRRARRAKPNFTLIL
uniref:Uncharacterized protein n=1 Tax=Phaeomonas parva TaxID=124430 RepID=A0A7S1U7Y5_9STRA|mmetsp:Transcript_34907/g.109650  ORF Transcript_34907/g.109650 Transcript_34907/m.109650 type:complete len:425 (+) Transcript_34907:205-1479(+)